jgi:hypothetical protein
LFIDLDGDGFGNRTASHPNCTAFYKLNDCDDRNDTTPSNRTLGSFSHPGLPETLCDGLDNDCNAGTPDSRAETCDLIDTDCNCGLYNDPTVQAPFVFNCARRRRREDDAPRQRHCHDVDNDTAYAFPQAFRTQCQAAGYMFDCNDTNTRFPSAEVCDGSTTTATAGGQGLLSPTRTRDLWPDFEVSTARRRSTTDGRLRAAQCRDQPGRDREHVVP